MDIFIGLLGLTALALALALLTALYNDSWALRISAILIARKEARVAYRRRYAEALAQREKEFELPDLRLQTGEGIGD